MTGLLHGREERDPFRSVGNTYRLANCDFPNPPLRTRCYHPCTISAGGRRDIGRRDSVRVRHTRLQRRDSYRATRYLGPEPADAGPWPRPILSPSGACFVSCRRRRRRRLPDRRRLLGFAVGGRIARAGGTFEGFLDGPLAAITGHPFDGQFPGRWRIERRSHGFCRSHLRNWSGQPLSITGRSGMRSRSGRHSTPESFERSVSIAMTDAPICLPFEGKRH